MEETKNLRTNIVLNTENKKQKEYQLILASKQLGTFFCVYANFEKEEENKYAVDFYLKNYKGAVNLELKSVKIKNHGNVVSIINIVVGLQSSDKPTIIKSLKLPEGEKTVNTKKGSWIVCELDVEIGTGVHQVFNTEIHHRNPANPEAPITNRRYSTERKDSKIGYIKFLKQQLGNNFPSSIKYNEEAFNKAVGDYCVIGISKVY